MALDAPLPLAYLPGRRCLLAVVFMSLAFVIFQAAPRDLVLDEFDLSETLAATELDQSETAPSESPQIFTSPMLNPVPRFSFSSSTGRGEQGLAQKTVPATTTSDSPAIVNRPLRC